MRQQSFHRPVYAVIAAALTAVVAAACGSNPNNTNTGAGSNTGAHGRSAGAVVPGGTGNTATGQSGTGAAGTGTNGETGNTGATGTGAMGNTGNSASTSHDTGTHPPSHHRAPASGAGPAV